MPVRTPVVIGIALVSAVCLAAVATYVHHEPHAVLPSQINPQSQVAPPVPSATKEDSSTEKAMVFTPSIGSNGISFTTQLVDYPTGIDATTKKIFAVNQFLRAAQITPPDALCIGVDLHDGLATLGFSPTFKQTYGSFDEKSLLDGLAVTLGQFKDVRFYNIEVNGVPLNSLGSVVLDQPVPVIRPSNSLKSASWDPGNINEKVQSEEKTEQSQRQEP